MSTINRLDEHSQALLRAGVVIPSFAAAVLALVRNSIDAGAKFVSVILEGFDVTVRDNGNGFKLTNTVLRPRDEVTGLQWRKKGESLSSIATLSQMLLVTSRVPDSSCGMQALVENSCFQDIHHVAGRTFGTTVHVKDMFFKVPVRKRCISLETAQTEVCKCIRTMLVPFPDVALHVATPHTSSLLKVGCHINSVQRFRSLFFAAPPALSDFEAVDWNLSISLGDVKVTGVIASERGLATASPVQLMYLNNRLVLIDAFKELIDDVYDDAWKSLFATRLLRRSTTADATHAVLWIESL